MSGALAILAGSATYGGADVLAGVDLSIEAGELVAVLGPNGAGKSTLVRALSGALALRAGSVELAGVDVRTLDRMSLARAVAVVHQHAEVALGFSVGEVVMMGRAPHQGRWMRPSEADWSAVAEALAACDLGGLEGRAVEALSGGEQRRVAIARALAQRANVLLLDEPTAHLDIRHALEVLAVVRREVEGRGVAAFAVLHDLNLAASHADRIVLLRGGRVAASGTPAEVMTRDVLEAVFEARLVVGEHADLEAPFVVPAPLPGSRRAGSRDL